MKREDMEETVLDMAKKLRAYADAVHGPTHARIAAVETCLQKLEDKIDENPKRLREEIREDLLQISAVQIRGSGTQRRCSLGRERGYTPRAELWFFLRDCGENMNRWDGKSTAALAQRVRELKEVKTQRGSSTKREAAPVSRSQTARYDDDDMPDPLEGTSKTYAQGKRKTRLRGALPLARPQFAFIWRGVQYTWNRLPQGWKHSPTICHGLIQTALEKGEAPEHLQYIDDIIVWGNTAAEVFEKGKQNIQILLEAGFTIKKSKVKGPAHEIQFLGVKWQDERRQIPTEVINKITAMSPPTNKKETQAFLGAIGFWMIHIPKYSQIVSPLYLVTRKKNGFHWGQEKQQAFAQIKQEITHAVALGPVRTGQDVKNVLYSAAGNNGLSWSLWQKMPGETSGQPLGLWSRSYRGSEANYTPTEKEILAAYKGVQAASEVIGTEAQLLAPRLPVLGWMFKGKVPSTHHATDATWSKWIALITQSACMGKLNRPGILEIITNWPEGENFGLTDEEQEQVTRAEEAPPYNQLPAEETHYALFTDGSCRIVGMNRKWKAAVWSPTRQVDEATEGEGGSSHLAELKAVQLALDIAEREGWPRLYLYTDSWMVANALWGWLKRWKEANWQRGGKPVWAAEEWKDFATRVGRLPVKVRHVDAHISKSRANEEHRNNEQVDRAAKIEVSKIDLDWEHKGELFLARWAHDASGHQGRDATYKWAQDREADLTLDSISQVIHDCETCAAIKQAKRVKPLWYGGWWSKYKYGEAWQIDYITLPQTAKASAMC
ncbi:hypothetical protein DUI87_00810 [Hirundo rustica rustica]|uniref:ribonuclease H n=1 Tax=Hirundo rustica rustica TaxID=333673 RepID=A0A3M0L3I7_HIRRU|nr:hypothetical protein DUI87_00810 [Hirundo rustica rustica]